LQGQTFLSSDVLLKAERTLRRTIPTGFMDLRGELLGFGEYKPKID